MERGGEYNIIIISKINGKISPEGNVYPKCGLLSPSPMIYWIFTLNFFSSSGKFQAFSHQVKPQENNV